MLLHAQLPFSLGYAGEQHLGNLWGQIKIVFSGCFCFYQSLSVSPLLFVCEGHSPGFCMAGLQWCSRWEVRRVENSSPASCVDWAKYGTELVGLCRAVTQDRLRGGVVTQCHI